MEWKTNQPAISVLPVGSRFILQKWMEITGVYLENCGWMRLESNRWETEQKFSRGERGNKVFLDVRRRVQSTTIDTKFATRIPDMACSFRYPVRLIQTDTVGGPDEGCGKSNVEYELRSSEETETGRPSRYRVSAFPVEYPRKIDLVLRLRTEMRLRWKLGFVNEKEKKKHKTKK